MAGVSRPITQEMVAGFERVREGTCTLTSVQQEVRIPQSTLHEKYRKWLRDQGAVIPVKVPTTQDTGLGGFSLRGIRTTTKKPQNSTRALLYSLIEGQGYLVEDLSREWNVQPDTLIKHAKAVDAFVYAELTQENWAPVITRPKR